MIALVAASSAYCQNEPQQDIATLTFENDLFIGEDNGYTNGVYFSWAHGRWDTFDTDNLPDWLFHLSKDLYISTMPNKHRAVSYLIGQAMQTPNDISRQDLIVDDAPYVGVLIWQGSLHAYDDHVADKLSFAFGITGPAAGTKASQKLVHRIVGADDPKGWSNQINNEPVFRINAERLWRLVDIPVSGSVGFDLIGIGSVGVGTLKSNVATGFGIRIGRGLDSSFPTATVMPGREVNPLAGSVTRSWSVFFNVLGEYVANDITINGNTFSDSHSVPLEHWQAQAVAGVSFNWERWAFLLSAVAPSDRHENQRESGRFGSLSVTYHY